MRKFMRQIDVRTMASITLVASLLAWGGEADAGPSLTPMFSAAEAFKYVVSALLGVLIWVAKGTDNRIKDLETFVKKSEARAIDAIARLEVVENEMQLMKHEHKNTVSLILAQRELLLTRYHDKDDTDTHRRKVETTLEKQQELLHKICGRLDQISDHAHQGRRWVEDQTHG